MYSDLNNAYVVIPKVRLLELLDDDAEGDFVENPPNAPYLLYEGCRDNAEAVIDAMLNGVYTVPFNPVPKIIRYYSSVLTVYNCWDRSHDLTDPDGIEAKRDNVYKALKKMKEGMIRIPGVPNIDKSVINDKKIDDFEFPESTLSKY